MMKQLLYWSVLIPQIIFAQNVGIGTTTPTAPLSFGNNPGNKILFKGNGSNAHYGIGIQNGQLQFYADQPSGVISFGSGRSEAFSERMRIINEGENGLELNGRIVLRNGTNPLDPAYGSGLWLYNGDNTEMLGFIGVQNNQNIGFYGGPGAWGLVYDATTSLVGIGNNNPSFRLDLTGRMRIRNGGDGDAGIYLNNKANTDFAGFVGLQDDSHIGLYGAGGIGWGLTMNTATGALSVNGKTGTALQALTSRGGNAAPAWQNIGADVYWRQQNSNSADLVAGADSLVINDMTLSYTFTQETKLVFNMRGMIKNRGCDGCGDRRTIVAFMEENGTTSRMVEYLAVYTPNSQFSSFVSGPIVVYCLPGTYKFKTVLRNRTNADASYGTAAVYAFNCDLVVQTYEPF